ncbi:MAG: segregation/condensation protein A [candidate division Zixibacteria bacterium]|nr:segregation/condensation protein A [candidate division Zixibacteria bacterium]
MKLSLNGKSDNNGNNSNYQVDLNIFQGPLDLLLYLIKKEEVDIYDIPVSKVTRQYLQYLEMMKTLSLEIAGEYIFMAATLIRIKTKMLLPRDENDTEEMDPREELVMALIEYKKYKEASEILREQAIMEEYNFVPPSPVGKIQGKVDEIPSTTLFDLLTAFKEVVEGRREEIVHAVTTEEIAIEDRIKFVMAYMSNREFATFIELFSDVPRKIVAVVTFMAILELCRSRRIMIQQSYPFEELRIYRGEDFERPFEAIDLVDINESFEKVEINNE